VLQSLPEVAKSIAALTARLASPSDPQRSVDVELVVGLELEHRLAELADRHHKPL
jgi:hypothetical protein